MSIGGPTVYRAKTRAHSLAVGTRDGVVFLTRDAAASPWRAADRELDGIHVSALLYEPETEAFFVASHGEGLFWKGHGGSGWTKRDQGISFPNIYTLNLCRQAGRTRLFAGTEPAHLFCSNDLGATWRELPALRSVPEAEKWMFPTPPHQAHVKDVACDPRNGDTILVAIEQGALLRSDDAGQSWRELSSYYHETDVVFKDVHRVLLSPSGNQTIFFTAGDGLRRSIDGGATWNQLTDRSMSIGYPDAFVLSPFNEDVMYMAGAADAPQHWRANRSADSHVARTQDGGQTWEILSQGLPASLAGNIEAMSMNVWSDQFALFIGTSNGEVFESDDQGATWEVVADGLPPISKGAHWRLTAPEVSA